VLPEWGNVQVGMSGIKVRKGTTCWQARCGGKEEVGTFKGKEGGGVCNKKPVRGRSGLVGRKQGCVKGHKLAAIA